VAGERAVRLLVLGGTRFVGRAVVAEALARGWDVTALNRGTTGALPDGATLLRADRTDAAALAAALAGAPGGERWDVVVDTWSGAPRVVRDAARLLVGRAGRYGYVSSASVYAWGQHTDETSPVVEGDPDAEDGDYPALKRGAELAVLAAFAGALLARAGLILGPHEDVGRLPWWLGRIAAGGRVVAPGRPDRPLQLVDVRDLAAWLLSGLASGLSGPVDVISRSGHATTEQLLAACVAVTGSGAELVWVDEDRLAAAGAAPWTHLPCWVPEQGDFAGFLEADTALAAATGLVCRPVAGTVGDTWAWLQREGLPPQRPDRAVHGLPADVERRLLAG
jgi:nucleoside-diphosphate-sugar epimerase